jgi:cytochrome c biogenesis protein CcmG, thiol:disulfide interchange protein DsbE
MRRLLLFAPLLLMLGLAVLFASRLRSTAEPQEVRSVLLNKPAPALTLAPLPGTPLLADADLGGNRVVIVNFFASWCAPCRVEHPQLMRLSRELGVPVLGIAWKDSPEAAGAFLKELGNPFARVGVDPSGRAGIDWGVAGVPESFVIGPGGIIRLRHWGDIRPEHIDTILMPAVTTAGGGS